MAIFADPRENFTPAEFDEIKQWLNTGGRCLLLLADGGEKAGGSNINSLIKEFYI